MKALLLGALGAVGLGALAYERSKPIGLKARAGDRAGYLVSDLMASSPAASLAQLDPNGVAIIEVVDTSSPDLLRGKLVGVARSFGEWASRTPITLSIDAAVPREQVRALERGGSFVSGPPGTTWGLFGGNDGKA